MLGQRNLVDPKRLQFALQTSEDGGSPFPQVLVGDDLVGDWELSRVVCELYGLPFVPVNIYEPDAQALEGLDLAFLRRHALVPVSRHGDLLTVAMPALVPAEVLGSLSAKSDVHVLPLVGSVETNNRWIEAKLADEVITQAPLPSPMEEPGEIELSVAVDLPSMKEVSDWSDIFDEGDAAVLMDLTSGESAGDSADPSESELPPPLPPPLGS